MSATSRRFYPSPSNVTYYIRDLLIDDVFRVDFQRKANHQPIWGFDSTTFDFVARGKEMVNGSIILNYRYPGYLRNAILEAANADYDTKKIVNQRMENANNSKDPVTFFQTIDNMTLENKAKMISNEISKKLLQDRAIKDYRALPGSLRTSTLVTELKNNMRKMYGTHTTRDGDPSDKEDYFRSILDEKELQFFDLIVRYGYQGVSGGYIRTFKSCLIYGESQTISAAAVGGGDLSSSAQPILEVYPFLAKTIVTSRYI